MFLPSSSFLSDRFPLEGPVVTASPRFVHPWVDSQVTGRKRTKHQIQGGRERGGRGREIERGLEYYNNCPDWPIALSHVVSFFL